jgi:seryl-tRNA synthetase
MEEIIGGAQKTDNMVETLTRDVDRQAKAIGDVQRANNVIREMSQAISAATKEQTVNARQVAIAIENVNELTQQAASAAEEMSNATGELTALATQLRALVDKFQAVGADGDDPQETSPVSYRERVGNSRASYALQETHTPFAAGLAPRAAPVLSK